ncbi:MAG: nucleotide exchange factor GrpE [Clostridiales Family XIII bacterium]|nr:nucleotide exchange factor GrpE [Clostridiales Family XIII bacterium]
MSEKKDKKIKKEKELLNEELEEETEAEAGTEAEAESEAGNEAEAEAGQADGDVAADAADADAGAAGEDVNIRYMRLAADFQNYKKRTEKERFTRYSEGKRDFAADLLPVLDNFERATSQDAAEGADAKFIEGMEMIYNQLIEVLAKNGIDEIASLGEEFDPNLHHAVQQIPSEEYESGEVASVLQKGYRSGEKIIRPSMVIVAS